MTFVKCECCGEYRSTEGVYNTCDMCGHKWKRRVPTNAKSRCPECDNLIVVKRRYSKITKRKASI